jgi:MFS family permease
MRNRHIQAMRTPLAAGIFGVIVATIVGAWLMSFLHSHADSWGLPLLAAICLSIGAASLAFGWWMDRRDAARKARGNPLGHQLRRRISRPETLNALNAGQADPAARQQVGNLRIDGVLLCRNASRRSGRP